MAEQTTARQIIFTGLVFAAIITGTFTMIANSVPEHSDKLATYNSTLNKFNTLKDNADEVTDKMKDGDAKVGPLGILNGLLEVSTGAIGQLWNSFTTLTQVILSLPNQFGIPQWFTGLIVSIIGVTLAFAIMSAIFKWQF